MSSFDRFRHINRARVSAQSNLNTHFIFKGYPSVTMNSDNDKNVYCDAVIVNQQEKDKAYIYTQLDDVLTMGSTWNAKGLHWLIAEEIVIIKDVNWHKYLSYLCNLEVEGIWGYFIGPEKHYVNIKNEQNTSLESLQKPVLVLPSDVLGFEDKIVIKGRPWLVQEYDAISSPGLIYYSLRATTISKEEAEGHTEDVYIVHAQDVYEDIIIEPVEEPAHEDSYIIGNDIDIELATEEGYFKTNNRNIKVKKLTGSKVIFTLPFGVNEAQVDIKQNGQIVTKVYRAK